MAKPRLLVAVFSPRIFMRVSKGGFLKRCASSTIMLSIPNSSNGTAPSRLARCA